MNANATVDSVTQHSRDSPGKRFKIDCIKMNNGLKSLFSLIYEGLTPQGVVIACFTAILGLVVVQTILGIIFPQPPIVLTYQPQMIGEITLEELSKYDGADPLRPILFAVDGTVYDVTEGRDFYGPQGGYHLFAGREIARALGKMQIDVKECNGDVSDFSEGHHETLAGWVRKFDEKYKVVGTVVPLKELTLEEMRQYDGAHTEKPIYLSVKGTVFDVTKGKDFYGPDGAYPFGGRECARALAKFSTEEADLTDNLEGCSLAELDALGDWIGRFHAKYSIVGRITRKEK